MTHNPFILDVLGVEGGYSDHPSDSGGKTMHGITEALARKYGYLGDMEDLSVDRAVSIIESEFWNPLALGHISKISPSVASELLDTAVNQGAGRAAEYLQISLNAFNKRGRFYPDLSVDRHIGPMTLAALRKFLDIRKNEGELVLLRALNCLQGAFYLQLSQARPKDEDFVYSWILNRVVI